MSTGKARRIGGNTLSTTVDTTPPEAPPPAPEPPVPGGELAVVPDAQLAERPPSPEPPPTAWVTVAAAPQRPVPPRASDIIQPKTEIAREQLNAQVPAELQLRRRMRQYHLDHDVELRDQMALAIDEWLLARGY